MDSHSHSAERPLAKEVARRLSVSVVIPAYTMDRWTLLQKAVNSVCAQTVAPEAVVVCIDNNAELFARATDEWAQSGTSPVRVIANRYNSHLEGRAVHEAMYGTSRRLGAGSARNTAVAIIASDVIAFLDDDAYAEPDWLENLLMLYADPTVMAAGGAPIPEYQTKRPAWFPVNFDWVFGCVYDGLPTSIAPLRRLIGANMSVRRGALDAIGGFVGNDFDDLNVCERLAATFGSDSLVYNPNAVVHHYVPTHRVSWQYFCRRCYFVNREKVNVLHQMGTPGTLSAERAFVWRSLRHRVVTDVTRGCRGEREAFPQLGAMFVGLGLAAAGHARGRWGLVTARKSG
jgi:glucosyl-dolichyl phosphate glucuronosyltransferase